MKSRTKFKTIAFIMIAVCISLYSCEKEVGTNENEIVEDEFEPVFTYKLYGSGYNYNPDTKMFSYTVYLHNKGNIGIILAETDTRLDQNDLFQVGVSTYSGFSRYSVSFQKNEFFFGQGKLGHEVAPDDVLKIEVIGIVNGNYSTSPNRTRLFNLHVYATRFRDFDEVVDRTF